MSLSLAPDIHPGRLDAADYAAYYAAGAAAYYAAAAAADVDDAVARNAERETQLADLVEVLSK